MNTMVMEVSKKNFRNNTISKEWNGDHDEEKENLYRDVCGCHCFSYTCLLVSTNSIKRQFLKYVMAQEGQNNS